MTNPKEPPSTLANLIYTLLISAAFLALVLILVEPNPQRSSPTDLPEVASEPPNTERASSR